MEDVETAQWGVRCSCILYLPPIYNVHSMYYTMYCYHLLVHSMQSSEVIQFFFKTLNYHRSLERPLQYMQSQLIQPGDKLNADDLKWHAKSMGSCWLIGSVTLLRFTEGQETVESGGIFKYKQALYQHHCKKIILKKMHKSKSKYEIFPLKMSYFQAPIQEFPSWENSAF